MHKIFSCIVIVALLLGRAAGLEAQVRNPDGYWVTSRQLIWAIQTSGGQVRGTISGGSARPNVHGEFYGSFDGRAISGHFRATDGNNLSEGNFRVDLIDANHLVGTQVLSNGQRYALSLSRYR